MFSLTNSAPAGFEVLLFIKPVLNNLIYDANKTDATADNVDHSEAIITRKNLEKNEMSFKI